MNDFLNSNDFVLINDEENRTWSGHSNIYKSVKSYFKELDSFNITLNIEKTSTNKDVILIQISIKINDFFKIEKDKFSLQKNTFSLFKRKKDILDFYKINTNLNITSNSNFIEFLHFYKDIEIEIISEKHNLYLLYSTNEIDVNETILKCLNLIDLLKKCL